MSQKYLIDIPVFYTPEFYQHSIQLTFLIKIASITIIMVSLDNNGIYDTNTTHTFMHIRTNILYVRK